MICFTYFWTLESALTSPVGLLPQPWKPGLRPAPSLKTRVVGEVIKSYYNAGRRPPLYYYLDKEQLEIDLVIRENDILYPIEIKKSGNPQKNTAKRFAALAGTGLEVGNGSIICLTGDLIRLDENNRLVPAADLTIGTLLLGHA
jgi:predicted AAA+ superfamily ATPase